MFTLRDKKVVLSVPVNQIPELKAVVDKYPKDYINVLTFINYMTNPRKSENPYLEMSEGQKITVLRRDFPGDYTENDKEVKAAIERMVADFIDLPEDRLFKAAQGAVDHMSEQLKTLKPSDVKELNTMMTILKSIGPVAESLNHARNAREKAREKIRVAGDEKRAYDQ